MLFTCSMCVNTQDSIVFLIIGHLFLATNHRAYRSNIMSSNSSTSLMATSKYNNCASMIS